MIVYLLELSKSVDVLFHYFMGSLKGDVLNDINIEILCHLADSALADSEKLSSFLLRFT